MKIRILYEDDELIAVHKPAGMTIYPEAGAGADVQTQLKQRFRGAILPVHRLDRGTCGIVVFAREVQWAQKLQRLFLKRQTAKVYWAVVGGEWEGGARTLREPLRSKEGEEQSAVTRVRPRGVYRAKPDFSASWLEIEPETGRFHQIRKHLKGVGSPILGDPQ